MTIKDFIDIVGHDRAYWGLTELLINGGKVDDVSFGIRPSDNQLIVNLESYGKD